VVTLLAGSVDVIAQVLVIFLVATSCWCCSGG
jgi:hypothetical protein